MRHKRYKGRERVQQQGCLVASRFPVPRPHPISMSVGTPFCASTWEGVHRDCSSSLSISPFVSPVARTDPTEPRFVVAQRDACGIQTTPSLPPLASINPIDDVTRTEIWIIGARPSIPRLTQGSNCLCLDVPSSSRLQPLAAATYPRRPLQPRPAPSSPTARAPLLARVLATLHKVRPGKICS